MKKTYSRPSSLFIRFLSYNFLDLCNIFRSETGLPCSAISSSRAALRFASIKSASVIRSFFPFFFGFMVMVVSYLYRCKYHVNCYKERITINHQPIKSTRHSLEFYSFSFA